MKMLHTQLREARKQAGLSQEALAELAGIPRNQVARAERGDNITLDTLRKIAAHLPVTELTLLDVTVLQVDAIPELEKLHFGAAGMVQKLLLALASAIEHALNVQEAMNKARSKQPLPGLRPDAMFIDYLSILEILERQAMEMADPNGRWWPPETRRSAEATPDPAPASSEEAQTNEESIVTNDE